MNTIPDAWSIHEKFILLPINKWYNEYQRVNIGGISCDHSDYYNSEDLNQEVVLPITNEKEKEPLYIGFFSHRGISGLDQWVWWHKTLSHSITEACNN